MPNLRSRLSYRTHDVSARFAAWLRGAGFRSGLTAFVFCVTAVSTLAAPPAPRPTPMEEMKRPGQIGSSGFVVPIPEIKMRNIVGDQPQRPVAEPHHETPTGPPPVREHPKDPSPPALPPVIAPQRELPPPVHEQTIVTPPVPEPEPEDDGEPEEAAVPPLHKPAPRIGPMEMAPIAPSFPAPRTPERLEIPAQRDTDGAEGGRGQTLEFPKRRNEAPATAVHVIPPARKQQAPQAAENDFPRQGGVPADDRRLKVSPHVVRDGAPDPSHATESAPSLKPQIQTALPPATSRAPDKPAPFPLPPRATIAAKTNPQPPALESGPAQKYVIRTGSAETARAMLPADSSLALIAGRKPEAAPEYVSPEPVRIAAEPAPPKTPQEKPPTRSGSLDKRKTRDSAPTGGPSERNGSIAKTPPEALNEFTETQSPTHEAKADPSPKETVPAPRDVAHSPETHARPESSIPDSKPTADTTTHVAAQAPAPASAPRSASDEKTVAQGANRQPNEPKTPPSDYIPAHEAPTLSKNETGWKVAAKPEPAPEAPVTTASVTPERTESAPTHREIPAETVTPKAASAPAETAKSDPPPPAQEAPVMIASPLASNTPANKEVREYLKEMSPILEDLSLIMARAPQLAVADFDPSEPEAAIFPKDIYLRMESLKRQLQVLDSKTFAIIAPPKYTEFHQMIRESINKTYLACDSIVGYFQTRSNESLRAVQENLDKARRLMQQIRTAQG